jgi:hypothetical protein
MMAILWFKTSSGSWMFDSPDMKLNLETPPFLFGFLN